MSTGAAAVFLEERIALIIDRPLSFRDTKRIDRLLNQARLKVGSGDSIRHHQICLVTCPTDSGTTWLACALGNAACRQGFPELNIRLPHLIEELRIAHGDGSFTRRLGAPAKTDVLLIDDSGLAAPQASDRSDTCSMCLLTASARAQPSTPANFLSSIGMSISPGQPSQTPSSTTFCRPRTALPSPASRCGKAGATNTGVPHSRPSASVRGALAGAYGQPCAVPS